MPSAFLSAASCAQVFASSSGSIGSLPGKVFPADDLLDCFRHEIANGLAAGNSIPDRRRRNVDSSPHHSVALFERSSGAVQHDELDRAGLVRQSDANSAAAAGCPLR